MNMNLNEKTLKEMSKEKIIKIFLKFQKDMNNIWEEFNYLEYYIKTSKIEKGFKLNHLFIEQSIQKEKKDAGGMKSKFLSGNNSKNHFIDSISLFEKYISNLAIEIYKLFPRKIENNLMDVKKLMEIIITHETKEEILDYIIEERVRSIFYGNPVDILKNDKCKFELNDTFKLTYKKVLEYYNEIVAKRNIIIHNLGNIDRKYIREISGTSYKLKQKVIINSDYLRGSISLLLGIAAKITECIIQKILKYEVNKKLLKVVRSFENSYNNNWYDTLLLNNQEN